MAENRQRARKCMPFGDCTWNDVYFVKTIYRCHFGWLSRYPLHKKCYFKHLKNEKWVFLWNMSKSLFSNIACHPTMNTCAKFGHISTNYVMNVAKTLLLHLESYECSFVIASFWEHFFHKTFIMQVYIFFLVIRSHMLTLREGFPLFWFFFISCGHLKI